MRRVTIFADGCCLNNGNSNAIGGYGCILVDDLTNTKKEISGVVDDSNIRCTNQRAELSAVINGILALKKPCIINVITDSQYVVSTMNQGWKKKANLDLWKELEDLNQKHNITWIHTYGHSGHPQNERCDRLANLAAQNEQSKKRVLQILN